jgi:hypothetical protein
MNGNVASLAPPRLPPLCHVPIIIQMRQILSNLWQKKGSKELN